jgi:hypothetical protein
VAVLAHAAILVDPDIDQSIAATSQFYRLCGEKRELDPAQHVSICALLQDTRLAAEPFSARLSDFLERQ